MPETPPLAFDAAGTGPRTVVLLHGIGGGRRLWGLGRGGLGDALAAAGWRVLALDLPGYGGSPLPAEPLTVAAMAQAVRRTVASQCAGPVVLLGHSMGGMVAQELAATSAAGLQALVLACTSSAFGPPGGGWQQGFVASRLQPLDEGLGMAGLAAQLVPAMVAPQAGKDAVAEALGVMSAVPEATYRAALQAIVAFDRRAALAGLDLPVLCLAAEHDRTAPPDVMARMAGRLPQGRFAVIPGAGHLATVEQPAACAAAITAFLQTLEPPVH
jgi:pimeloyl-ACP methyl ester carboxylesterase